MVKFLFDKIKYLHLPDPGRPIFYRINKKPPGVDLDQMQDMYWSHSDNNRFSLAGIKQMYLAVSLDSISEATPWEDLKQQAGGANNFSIPFDSTDLEDYYVSYIRPNHKLILLDFTDEQARYGREAGNHIANGKDYDLAREFSRQCYENSRVDGIYYTSAKNPVGRNIYLFDRCAKKFDSNSVIAREPLVKAIKPMKEILENRLGIEFLL